jgi:predicted nucleic acid-binding protein
VILLDTTVLSYAVGDEHYLRDPCRRLLKAHANGLLRATTTIEVIQEFAHVRARRRSRADAASRARQYAAAFVLLVTRAEDLDLGLALYVRYQPLGAFDAVLAAVALNQQVDALVSADRCFGDVPHLPWIDPATPALDHLLADASG